ncbi:MAG: DUF429 domain-containing protein [Caldilineaceae bacterium]
MTTVVSIDLATRRYADIGVAVLTQQGQALVVDFARPRDHSLAGEPNAQAFAEWTSALAREVKAQVITIDGPQAWKDPANGLLHSRVSERLLHTQTKTGSPGVAKPGTGLRFVTFSIEFFDHLTVLGWPRLMAAPVGPLAMKAAVEVFPTAAWRALGLAPLPAKSKAKAVDVALWLSRLQALRPLVLNGAPTHDELQALIGGLGGLALARGVETGYQLLGNPPFRRGDVWYEGYILNMKRNDSGLVTNNTN